MLPREIAIASPALITLGIASIGYGAVQATARHDTAAVIAYSAIGQVGYIMIAVAIGGAIGYAAAIVFTVINSLNKTLLFLAADQTNRYAGIAFAIGGLSVAGIPPALGFWNKAAVLRATLTAEAEALRVLLAAVVVVGGGMSLLYMFQSYGRAFWHAPRDPKDAVAGVRTGLTVAGALLLLVLGLWPEPLLALSDQAAAVLLRGSR
jgi:multicomponent Na+:H+ antiporter subunit D